MEVPEQVGDFIRRTVAKMNPGIATETINRTISEQLEAFRKSDVRVYCVDCGLLFYVGNVNCLMDDRFWDWKMLAFRHVWDTNHMVKVTLGYFARQRGLPRRFLEASGLVGSNGDFDYSMHVRKFRDRLEHLYDPRAKRTNDQNWDSLSSCFCSVCEEEYQNPKEACYCCFGQKPWMPYNEVDTIVIQNGC